MRTADQQIAVVTGGASGLGAATAKRLASSGTTVITWDLSESADVVCDVADPDSVVAALRATVAKAGVPNILVAAAGIVNQGPFLDLRPDEWDRVMNVNLRGPFLCLQAVAREMIAHNLEGSMVVVSSISGLVTDPQVVPYSVSKAGALHLVRVVARELGEFGIRVNAVCPGPMEQTVQVRVPPVPASGPLVRSQEDTDRLIGLTPLGRIGRADDVAEAIVGLLTMGWVTGQVIAADGGTSLMTPRGGRRATPEQAAAVA
jgi:NAD(P)-dependent dehydrogenase (short-subunit alcohol dehydrogenase family)